MAADEAAHELEPMDESLLERVLSLPGAIELDHPAADLARDDDLDQALLVLEAPEHGHLGDAGAARDVVDRGAADAVLGELLQRRRGDPVDEWVRAWSGSGIQHVRD